MEGPRGKPKTETMRRERNPVSMNMFLQQQNHKEEGLRKSLKRRCKAKEKAAPTNAGKNRTIKKNSWEDEGLKQD